MDRRKFLTFLTGVMSGIAATVASIPFIRSMSMTDDKVPPDHGRIIEFPKLEPGQMIAVSVANKPLYITRRTEEQIANLGNDNPFLGDPGSIDSVQPKFAQNVYRSVTPEIFVAWGICTHLGCAVTHYSGRNEDIRDNPDQRLFSGEGGFYCPCHSSKFDFAGRVYSGNPAPTNLEVPNYEIVDENSIRYLSNAL